MSCADDVEKRFYEAMREFCPFENDAELVVAVSGGSDSLALTFLLNDYVAKHGGKLIALTVDHGLRPESAAEAAMVSAVLTKHGIYHEILTWRGEKPRTSVEEKAREARYDLLFSYMRERGLLHLFVAHTRDEQAETFLLRMRRGSGVDGLSSMRPEVLYRDLRVLRPLLGFSKDELRDYLTEKRIDWVDDPSNFDISYDRVKVRQLLKIMRDYGLGAECIDRAVLGIRRAKDAIDDYAAKAMAETLSLHSCGFIALDAEKLLLHPKEVVFRVLSRIIFVISGNHVPVRMEKISSLADKLSSVGNGITLGGCFIKQYRGKVVFVREVSFLPPRIAFADKGRWGHFTVSAPGFHGFLGALGADGYAQIREKTRKRYFSAVTYGLPALFHDKKVVFVPHLRYYADKFVEIDCKLDIECSLT